MESEFEDKVAAFVRAYELIGPGGKVMAAVSGGADSMALLHSLCRLRARGVFSYHLVCAHVNHRLRGPESDVDECFVRSQARALGLPFFSRSLDVTGFAKAHRQSIETAARHLRMQALLEMAKEAHCQAIATGHHKDDNAETVVQRMARGTGLRGLAGIWPSRMRSGGVRIVRPLLGVTRQEAVQYLRKRDLTWREDSTNADCRFRRNFLRHRLLPALQAESPSCLVESLSGLALSAYGLYAKTLLPAVDRVWPAVACCTSGEELSLDVEALKGQPPYVQIELMRQALTRLGCGERDLTDLHYTRLLALIAAKTSGKAVSLPGGFTAWRRGGHIRIGRQRPPSPPTPDRGPAFLEIPGQARLGHRLIEAVVLPLDGEQGRRIRGNTCRYKEWLDLDRLRPPLVVRRRRPGDRFHPLGQAGDKKVGRFLIDARVPREGREEVLVVEDQERIVWVCPVRISDTVKVTEATRRVVQISVRPTEN